MTKKADIGLIGLAVMGENLVLNMESKGFTVAVFNRTVDKVDSFINGRGEGKKFIGAHSIEELCASLERFYRSHYSSPRKGRHYYRWRKLPLPRHHSTCKIC